MHIIIRRAGQGLLPAHLREMTVTLSLMTPGISLAKSAPNLAHQQSAGE